MSQVENFRKPNQKSLYHGKFISQIDSDVQLDITTAKRQQKIAHMGDRCGGQVPTLGKTLQEICHCSKDQVHLWQIKQAM